MPRWHRRAIDFRDGRTRHLARNTREASDAGVGKAMLAYQRSPPNQEQFELMRLKDFRNLLSSTEHLSETGEGGVTALDLEGPRYKKHPS